MRHKKQIEQEVDKTLASLDGVERTGPAPFLFTRIQAKLDKDEKGFWGTALALLSRPRVAFATVVIVICANAIIFFSSGSETASATSEGEQTFATEYNVTANSIYDSTVEPE